MKEDNVNKSEILEVKEVCEYLHICRGTIRKLGIPYLKIRRRILYRKCDVDKFIVENLKETNI